MNFIPLVNKKNFENEVSLRPYKCCYFNEPVVSFEEFYIFPKRYCKPLLVNPEFQLSRTNGSRVIEKGCGSTFEVSHALLNHRTPVQI